MKTYIVSFDKIHIGILNRIIRQRVTEEIEANKFSEALKKTRDKHNLNSHLYKIKNIKVVEKNDSGSEE